MKEARAIFWRDGAYLQVHRDTTHTSTRGLAVILETLAEYDEQGRNQKEERFSLWLEVCQSVKLLLSFFFDRGRGGVAQGLSRTNE